MYGGEFGVCIHGSAWPKDQRAHTSRREKGLCMHGGRRGRARPKDWWGRACTEAGGVVLGWRIRGVVMHDIPVCFL